MAEASDMSHGGDGMWVWVCGDVRYTNIRVSERTVSLWNLRPRRFRCLRRPFSAYGVIFKVT